jgi:flagellar biosynthesis chaperone FliJ
MKFEVTNPKAWKAVNEKNMPMKHKIKVYEKLGGAYRLGKNGGEQVFNTMTDLLKNKMNEDSAVSMAGADHEVSMAQHQLDAIIKGATELKGKMGMQEKDLPGWVQDHVSEAYQFIMQANNGFTQEEEKLNKRHNG